MINGKRILVVEDNEAERMLIYTFLQQQGCRVYLAQDGIDGIHKARLLVPDLILMDYELPRCNGIVACKVLTEDPQTAGVPIIFLSAFSETERRIQGLLAGAVDYLGKPFNFDEVRLRLAVHLRNHSKPSLELPTEPKEQTETTSTNYLNEILFHGARVHLLNSLADTPTISELAALVGTNTKRLNEAFRFCSGVTVFEYLRELRMKEASQLLRETGLPVSEVACRVGFSNSANFSTAFRERFGTTPSRFRSKSAKPEH